MASYIDVSLGIGPELLTWPGDPGIEITPTVLCLPLKIVGGDGAPARAILVSD